MPGSPWFLGLRLLIAACAVAAAAVGGVCAAEPQPTSPVTAAHSPPDLPLAEVYVPGAAELGDYWVSEKLDGVRGYWDGKRMFSRGGHRIRAPDCFTAAFPPVPLDGELWLGRGRFAEMSGLARRQVASPAEWRDVRYMVFDLPPGDDYMDADFSTRLGRLRELVAEAGSPHLVLVEQARVDDHGALMTRMHAVVAAGGEGLMLRRDAAPYRGGRSNDLLKVKPHLDAEARVIGHLPGQGKYLGMMGALLVEETDGTRFRLGTGFTDAERAEPPAIGSLVTFRYQGRTKNGLPRFARFLRVRVEP